MSNNDQSKSNDTAKTFKYATREEWLQAAIEYVRPMVNAAAEAAGMAKHSMPTHIRVSCGFGWAKAENSSILGQTFASVVTDDGQSAVFVSPVIASAEDALMVLMHELVHVVDDCISGHSGRFVEIGKALGLDGKPTQMLPATALQAELMLIAADLGDYPHSRLDIDMIRAASKTPSTPSKPRVRVSSGPAAQHGSRHIKAVCMNSACDARGYLVRTSAHWISVATPICPVCKTDMHVS